MNIRTEHAVPDDKHASVVLVNAVAVDAVVNTVVARRVENVFKRPKPADRLLQDEYCIRKLAKNHPVYYIYMVYCQMLILLFSMSMHYAC